MDPKTTSQHAEALAQELQRIASKTRQMGFGMTADAMQSLAIDLQRAQPAAERAPIA